MNRIKELLRKSDLIPLLTCCIMMGIVFGQVISNNILFSSHVVGDSMNPTYVDSERVFVNRLKTPERGDIIIVDECEKYVIKRCVGMPGDTIQIIDGIVYIDGVEYKEDYIKDGSTNYSAGIAASPVELHDGEYFMLGDNRAISRDSRIVGVISEDMIVGVVVN